MMNTINRQILRRYLTQDILPLLTSEGFWGAPDPAPLSSDEVIEVFEQVANHSSYENQRLEIATADGKRVSLNNGKISIVEPETN